mgnify:FL=1
MRHPMILFALATLAAPILLGLGALWGGAWIYLGLAWITLLAAVLDEAVALTLPAEEEAAEFPRADALSIALVVAQLALLALVVATLGRGALSWAETLALALGTGLFLGQVGNSNAHELIHRSSRLLHRAGVLAYLSVLYGQHVSGHLLVHHVHVGTKADPNSARWGEGLYRFLLRAWPGELRRAFAAERARDRASGRPAWRNPFVTYALGGLAFCLAARALGGPAGLAWFLALAVFAQLQLLTSDYVQHYGLRRLPGPSGRPEPVRSAHSWNAPHWFSSALMLNAPRHSDHHAHPTRPYPALRLDEDMPRLPYSLPVMACIALWPRHWRRLMDPLATSWQNRMDERPDHLPD